MFEGGGGVSVFLIILPLCLFLRDWCCPYAILSAQNVALEETHLSEIASSTCRITLSLSFSLSLSLSL